MLQTIKNFYKTNDLTGEFLLRPLKNRIAEPSDMKLARLVKNIFTYPIFALLALIGMGIKLTGIPGLIIHNSQAKKRVTIFLCIPKDQSRGGDDFGRKEPSYNVTAHNNYTLTRDNTKEKCQKDKLEEEIKNEINSLSWKFKRVFVRSTGQIEIEQETGGKIELELMVRDDIRARA